MPNHYHLLVSPTTAALSHQMQLLGISFTKATNRRFDRVGPLFQGQFQAMAVRSDAQLIWLSRCIHRNPLEAGLEQHIGSWPYTSFPDYLGNRPGSLPSVDLILGVAGGRAAYRAFVSADSQSPPDEIGRLMLET